jgi:HAE1 family hydrophobic/amphiphilic exporter-1
MTTLTTVLGMLPIALGLGAGAELQAPMARVVVAGLTVGTVITLVAIPLVYLGAHTLLDSAKSRARRGEPQAQPVPAPVPATTSA